jgi:hypothetical protein
MRAVLDDLNNARSLSSSQEDDSEASQPTPPETADAKAVPAANEAHDNVSTSHPPLYKEPNTLNVRDSVTRCYSFEDFLPLLLIDADDRATKTNAQRRAWQTTGPTRHVCSWVAMLASTNQQRSWYDSRNAQGRT